MAVTVHLLVVADSEDEEAAAATVAKNDERWNVQRQVSHHRTLPLVFSCRFIEATSTNEEEEAHLEATSCKGRQGFLPLHLAVKYEVQIIDMFLDHVAKANVAKMIENLVQQFARGQIGFI